jgi:hypothetical protein
MKPVKVSFIDSAANEWERLNKVVVEEKASGIENSENQQLLRSIKQKIELIKMNPQYGSSVKKKQIPKKFPIDNLWVVDLTGFWRMLYTLKGSQIEILCFILEIFDHKRYDKLFGYKKK